MRPQSFKFSVKSSLVPGTRLETTSLFCEDLSVYTGTFSTVTSNVQGQNKTSPQPCKSFIITLHCFEPFNQLQTWFKCTEKLNAVPWEKMKSIFAVSLQHKDFESTFFKRRKFYLAPPELLYFQYGYSNFTLKIQRPSVSLNKACFMLIKSGQEVMNSL